MKLPGKIRRTASIAAHLFSGVRRAAALEHAIVNGIPSNDFQTVRQQWLKELCDKLPLTVEMEGSPHDETSLWVSNHVSWMDIPVIGSLAPVGFLSKSEVSQWPVVGKLAARSGTLFIERGGNSAAAKAIETMTQHLHQHHNILFFPEGTTTDGNSVRNFHPRLLSVAIDNNICVQPVSISYFGQNGELSEVAPYINDDAFHTSFWAIMGAEPITVRVRFLPPVINTPELARKELARTLQGTISESISVVKERHRQIFTSG